MWAFGGVTCVYVLWHMSKCQKLSWEENMTPRLVTSFCSFHEIITNCNTYLGLLSSDLTSVP